MSLVARPLATSYKNQGEHSYKLGIEVVDENGDDVDITGDVSLIISNAAGLTIERSGQSSENQAYYTVQSDDMMCLVSDTYLYWVDCFNLDRYGPFELKIMYVPSISS